ncbi:MAG: 30S ribosomal protein S5 [Candidatus Aenigmarchaeota archaeon]|nr:30S ribosomal protein S5 [Candidatus Aenigmarchaeota archaeon]
MYEERTTVWIPKTDLGREVFEGKILSLDEIFETGRKIKEPQIVDKLLPNLKSDVIFIGGSPGKGGGIKRTPTKRTARMHRSGRRYNIVALVVIGNGDGYFGVGKGESAEHREAISKATENAKLNIIPIKRGCGSWECACSGKHSLPFRIEGSEGSVKVVLKPAPKGIGLCINDEAKKAMRLAGIADIWCKSFGNTGTRSNYIIAIFNAFKKMNKMKIAGETLPEEEKEEKKTKKKAEEAKAAKSKEKKEEAPKENKKKLKKKNAKKQVPEEEAIAPEEIAEENIENSEAGE